MHTSANHRIGYNKCAPGGGGLRGALHLLPMRAPLLSRRAADTTVAPSTDATAQIMRAAVEFSLRARLKEYETVRAEVRFGPACAMRALVSGRLGLCGRDCCGLRAPRHDHNHHHPQRQPHLWQVDCDAMGVLEGRFRSMAITGDGWRTPLGMTARRLEVGLGARGPWRWWLWAGVVSTAADAGALLLLFLQPASKRAVYLPFTHPDHPPLNHSPPQPSPPNSLPPNTRRSTSAASTLITPPSSSSRRSASRAPPPRATPPSRSARQTWGRSRSTRFSCGRRRRRCRWAGWFVLLLQLAGFNLGMASSFGLVHQPAQPQQRNVTQTRPKHLNPKP